MLVFAVIAQAAAADDLLPAPPSAPPTQPAASQPPSAQPPGSQSPAQSPPPQAVAEARAACAVDLQRLCAGVQPGGGRILACLKQHQNQVSPGCKQAVMKLLRRSN
jgi:hypothetical protein